MDKKLQKLLKGADQERVEGYMHMFDRVLLYTLAANMMPSKSLDDTIGLWDKVVKKSIDFDATKRTEFMEETVLGRASKLKDEIDGESLRLYYLKQWKVAREIIAANLQREDEDDNSDDSDDDFFDQNIF